MLGLFLLAMLTTSCVRNQVSNYCPSYPHPPEEVINKIENLQDPLVDAWMIEQLKLSEKLELCQ